MRSKQDIISFKGGIDMKIILSLLLGASISIIIEKIKRKNLRKEYLKKGKRFMIWK